MGQVEARPEDRVQGRAAGPIPKGVDGLDRPAPVDEAEVAEGRDLDRRKTVLPRGGEEEKLVLGVDPGQLEEEVLEEDPDARFVLEKGADVEAETLAALNVRPPGGNVNSARRA
jgi:hypothetical protein